MEVVYIVAGSRDYAERAARAVTTGHFRSYASAEAWRLSLPAPQRERLQVFDVARTVAHDGVIVIARAACVAAGFLAMGWAAGLATII